MLYQEKSGSPGLGEENFLLIIRCPTPTWCARRIMACLFVVRRESPTLHKHLIWIHWYFNRDLSRLTDHAKPLFSCWHTVKNTSERIFLENSVSFLHLYLYDNINIHIIGGKRLWQSGIRTHDLLFQRRRRWQLLRPHLSFADNFCKYFFSMHCFYFSISQKPTKARQYT
jgi:hypothetical protein